MTTWAQYVTQRNTAGATYQTALTNLRNAMIDLLALDAVVSNKTINSGSSVDIKTLTGVQESLNNLTHPQFGGTTTAPCIMDAVRAQAATYMSNATP